MYWITLHSFLSLSWDEWGSIILIVSAIFTGTHRMIKRLADKTLDPINTNLKILNSNFNKWNEWHNRADERLNHGDQHFMRHDLKLQAHEHELEDHENRIRELEGEEHKHE